MACFRDKCISVLFLLLAISQTFQSVFAQKEKLTFTNYTSESGLNANIVNAITQDKYGFLWIGSHEGLIKYDGYNFRKILPDSGKTYSVFSLLADNNNNLWIGTDNGLVCIDLKSGIIKDFKSPLKEYKTTINTGINCLFEDIDSNIWIGSNEGLYKLNPTQFQIQHYKNAQNRNSISDNRITSIIQDDKGTLWIGTKNGLNKFNIQSEKFEAVNFLLGTNEISSLAKDKNKHIWIGTPQAGLIDFNPANKHVRHFHHSNQTIYNIINGEIKCILEDKKGNLWAGTTEGLSRYDPASRNFLNYRRDAGIPTAYIYTLFEDASQVLWVGNHFGLSKINNRDNFHNLSDESGLSSQTAWSIVEDDDGKLWIGTSKGLDCFDKATGQTAHFFNKEGNYPELYTKSLCIGKNDILWIGSISGLTKYNVKSKTFQNFRHSSTNAKTIPGNVVETILEDENGILWIGTDHGFCKMDIQTNQITRIEAEPDNPLSFQTNKKVRKIFEDKNKNLWIGTVDGLFFYTRSDKDSGKNRFTHFKHAIENPYSLSYDFADVIMQDSKGRIWVGTYGNGLCMMAATFGKFINYTEKNGLCNNSVDGLLEDNRGNIWISTENGLSKFNPETKEFSNFDMSHGISNMEFCVGAYCKLKSGNLWFGGTNGITHFDPEKIKENPYPPSVAITSVKKFNDVIPGNNLFNYSDLIDLDFMDKSITFEFTSLDFTNNSKNQYAYMLEGFDPDWNYYSGKEPKAVYNNLPPGNYIFKVKASNNDMVWNDSAASIPVYIAPPFYLTWWFYTLSVVTCLLLMITIFRAKLKHAKLKLEREMLIRRNNEKEILLKEIHHRVKNNLQVINTLLKWQSAEIEDERLLESFEDAQNRVISMALLHEHMYKSENLKHIDVSEYIESLARGLISTYEVDKEIDLEINVDAQELEMKTLLPLSLIINEVIANSIKYAFKGRKRGTIVLGIKQSESNMYEMIIGDDGIGMKKDYLQKTDSLGIELIKTFTEQLEGKIEHLDCPGTLYKITFSNIVNV